MPAHRGRSAKVTFRRVRPTLAAVTAAIAVWLAAAAPPRQQPSAARPPSQTSRAEAGDALLARAANNQRLAMRRLTQYCFHQQVLDERYDGDGQVASREQRDELVCHEDSVPRYRRLAVNGVATGATDKEPWPPIARDSDDWKKQVRRAADSLQRWDQVIAEIPRAFDLVREGDEMTEGRPATVYRLAHKPGYQPSGRVGDILRCVGGRAWLDNETAHMLRLRAVVEDDFNMWGGLVLKVRKGAVYELHQQVVHGTWLPVSSEERWQVRIGLIKNRGQHLRLERRDFQLAKPFTAP